MPSCSRLLLVALVPVIVIGCGRSCRSTEQRTPSVVAVAESPDASIDSEVGEVGTDAAEDAPETAAEEVSSMAWTFAGAMGPKLPIRMKLVRTGTSFVGEYVYVKHPSPIALKGTWEPSGSVALEETVDGKVTGSFRGRIDGGRFDGTWSDPSNSRTLAFTLDAAHGRMLFLGEQRVDWKGTGTIACAVAASWYEALFGLDDGAARDLNKLLRPDDVDDRTCNEAHEASVSSSLHVNDDGVLSVLISTDSTFAHAAHPQRFRSYVNFWIDEGRSFDLHDALAPTAAAILSSHSDDLPTGSGDPGEPNLSSLLTLDNQEFVVEREGIRLFAFNALPYVHRGTLPEGVLVTFDELRSAIKKPGPLAKLAAPR